MLIIYHELLYLASINDKNLSLAINLQNSFFYFFQIDDFLLLISFLFLQYFFFNIFRSFFCFLFYCIFSNFETLFNLKIMLIYDIINYVVTKSVLHKRRKNIMKRILGFIVAFIIIIVGCSAPSEEIKFKDYSEGKTQIIYSYLLENGDLSPTQAAGITAVIKQQSNFDTSVHQNGTTGLMCWSFKREKQLNEFAREKDSTVTNLYTQLDFILEEIDSDSEYYQLIEYHGYSPEDWKKASTPEKSALAFVYIYVRPGTFDEDALQSSANEIYEACTSSKSRQLV